jgi:anti-sigma factor RsiW
LSAPERRQIQSHLRQCRNCAHELKLLREAVKALPAAKETKLAAAKRKALHQRLQKEANKTR